MHRTLLLSGAVMLMTSTGTLANENCRRLEALAQQYAGVQLTSAQVQIKRRMVAWYNKNCGSTRRADVRY
jgi:hypothetical protein